MPRGHQHRVRFPVLLRYLFAVVLIAVLGGIGWWLWHRHDAPKPSTANTAGSSQSTVSTSGSYVMIEDFALPELQKAGMSSATITRIFNTPRTLLIQQDISDQQTASDAEQGLPNATVVTSFASFAKLQQAFAANTIGASTKYILYDNENWSATPPNEQADPIGYEQKAETLVHAHGRKLIFTPAADLAHVLDPKSTDKYASYLALGLASQGAKYADVFEIQAQQDEALSGFTSFVTQAVNQVKSSNPSCVILVGIGSNPAGRTVSSQDVESDYHSVTALVNGFWFNIPGKNPQPQVAVSFFDDLFPNVR